MPTSTVEGAASAVPLPTTAQEAASLPDDVVRAVMAGPEVDVHRLLELLAEYDADQERRLSAPDALAGAASWYASLGVAVFPCRPGEKVPLTARGFHDATTDKAQVRQWWKANPRANIGAPTGQRFDVLDIDSPAKSPGAPNGYLTVADIRDAGLLPEPIGRAVTPSGGQHAFYPPGTFTRSMAALGPGLDVRSAGGYVVLPPSRDSSGRRYAWVVEPAFLDQCRGVVND